MQRAQNTQSGWKALLGRGAERRFAGWLNSPYKIHRCSFGPKDGGFRNLAPYGRDSRTSGRKSPVSISRIV
jgi:hypothetical protein